MSTQPIPAIAASPLSVSPSGTSPVPTPAASGQPSAPSPQSWSDADAYKIAMANFQHAQNYKTQNCEPRYRRSDELIQCVTENKYWEGTKVRRANVPVFTALGQIEALLPHVDAALFNEDLPFTARPFPGTTPEQARATMEFIRWQLQNLDPSSSPIPTNSLRELFRRGYKQDLTYGNMVIEFGWQLLKRNRTLYSPNIVPERQTIIHPVLGPVPAPTGKHKYMVTTEQVEQVISKPFAQNVDIRNWFFDPNCPSSNIQEGRHCAVRGLPAVQELLDLKDVPGFNIPDMAQLQELAKKKGSRPSDSTRMNTETSRGESWNPILEYNENPALMRVEVIRYFQPDRIIWIIPDSKEQGIVLYNQPNQYLMLPFLTSSYTDVIGRWQGMSICDLVDGDQHLAMSILNARIDELNLWIHRPIVRRRGSISSPSEKRLRPGASWETDGKPAEDVMVLEPGNITQQAFIEVDAIDRRVQKTTGNSDLAVIGTASAGGNSANRSATGIQAQTSASSTRIQYQVVNKEDHILTPLLYMIHWLDKRFLDPSKVTEVLGSDAQFLQINNWDVMNAECQFQMLASSKMRAKQALAAGGIQMILETVLNPALVEQLASQGVKVNYPEIGGLVCDTLNLPKKSIFLPMSPEEMQAQQQQKITPDMIRMMMQRERIASADQNNEENNETKLLMTILKQLITPDVAHQAQGLEFPEQIAAKFRPKPAPKQLSAGGKK